MKPLRSNNHATPSRHESQAAMAQVGWLGFSGNVYPWGTTLDEIHEHEKGGYEALYIQIGEWEQDDKGNWHVEED